MKRLTRSLAYFRRGERYGGGWQELNPRDREWEDTYRQRWAHDRVVRTTHGVNCTGSCSWMVHVKGGIVTFETQAVDYPSNGPDAPEYEPRGCPRGASFSWYIYSPLRVKHPYIRRALLEPWRELREKGLDPVEAFAALMADEERVRRYKGARGKGGFVRASWEEAEELVAAATVYTIKTYGPDRLAGFTPIPAMSMVSYAAGSRLLTLLGGVMVSFYDWYCDLPTASPEIWGEQTDVPESADWYNSGYILVWGTNPPMTRTPDAHFLAEARYRGARVVSISPDYAESTKFADEWLPVAPGQDGALAMAMTHVVLKEYYGDEIEPQFAQYVKQYTDLPFLVIMRKVDDGRYAPHRFLRASDLGIDTEHAQWKLAVHNRLTDRLAIPKGSLGYRWGEQGRWSLELEDGETGEPIDPTLTFLHHPEKRVIPALFPIFESEGSYTVERGIPAIPVEAGEETLLVTTVLDLMLANAGVSRGLPGDYPKDYDDPKPYTPGWQEAITGVKREQVISVARGFAENALRTGGRSMILMGPGVNHWFHQDAAYRAMLNLVLLCGCQGKNGGGWAHYVGQEKVRPLEGWQTVAFARDWGIPPRLQNGTSFWYFATGQYRYEETPVDLLTSPLASSDVPKTVADFNIIAARLGWLPSYPQWNANPLDLAEGEEPVQNLLQKIREGELKFAIEDPDHPANFTRILFVWRANPLTSSGKGQEYFLRHLLGTGSGVLAEEEATLRPQEMVWREKAAQGKLDLLVTLDFRMSGTALYSDVVLPAATWYEKDDLSTTDLHPFIHPFNPAVAPPWEARSDWDIFKALARKISELGKVHLGVRKDLVATPLAHDTPQEMAQPLGTVRDWKKGEGEPVPGKTFPQLTVVERDYGAIYHRFVALGPRVKDERGVGAKGVAWSAEEEYRYLQRLLGTHEEGPVAGAPRLEHGRQAAEAILTLSSATNGKVAVRGWRVLERRTGRPLADLAEGRAHEHFNMADLTAQPRKTITAPVWSGIEEAERRYTAFAVNVERLVPWRTLSGRQHFYLDHQWFLDFGEHLPVYRPPLPLKVFQTEGERAKVGDGQPSLVLRYLTPHGKWNIHSTYYDNERMLTLFRGGPNVWLSVEDAEALGVKDNDWLELISRNGVFMARAVVSHRLPKGVCYSYHVQDRTVHVPVSPITKERSGGHNSVTKIHMKPTHMVGGYAQLSYAFNYWGPVGTQRDEVVMVRKAAQKGGVW
ncbi:MAG: nitrate reductase subunit alpha [Clostridiales bacterium]|nr:nitrate reductase subunit alpha [Clostridiales bacterium]